MTKYLVVYEKTKTGFSAYVPDLAGVAATGNTKNEIEKSIYIAIQMHIESLREMKCKIPKPLAESEVMVFA